MHGPIVALRYWSAVPTLLQVLHQDPSSSAAGEAANVVLNICYERDNVSLIMDCGGVPPLISFLSRDAEDLQAPLYITSTFLHIRRFDRADLA